MAEFPALPLFTDAYLADTRHLTTEEHGAYLLLLMCAWRTRGCFLKDCDRTLARIAGVTRPRWRRLRPVLAEFFTIEDGVWRQKKLTDVYRGVEARVAKNRANGAKGGRAKAARTLEPESLEDADDSDRGGKSVPTKAKTRTRLQKPAAAAGDEISGAADVAAAALIENQFLVVPALAEWQAAGADMVADILPTITRLRAREEARSGKPPASAAYYTAAILEARDQRLGAVRRGMAHDSAHPPAPPKRAFDPASLADWRAFLGDATSRFRGDYLSQNWVIGRDHPIFVARELGCDPRHGVNKLIPPEIAAEYGVRWSWRRD